MEITLHDTLKVQTLLCEAIQADSTKLCFIVLHNVHCVPYFPLENIVTRNSALYNHVTINQLKCHLYSITTGK